MKRRAFLQAIGGGAMAASVGAGHAQELSKEEKKAGFKPLFNGRDLTGWRASREGATNWVARDGELVNERAGSNLVTEQKFQDFEVRYEYRIPKGSNSGFYLRGRYEIQIDDNHGKPVRNGCDGAIYGKIAPAENMTKPAGEWNEIRATLTGKRVTIIHNSKKTIDNMEIIGVTGAALDDKEGEPGPMYIQGDHGPVTFRNIRIREIKK